MKRYDFTSGVEGFVFKETWADTLGYWSGGRLYMDGQGSWGDAYWRIEFPRGIYSVAGVSTITVGFYTGANVFFYLGYWNWGETARGIGWTITSPATYTATRNEEVKCIGYWCGIHGVAYMEYLELDGFTGIGDIYTSGVQLGSVSTNGIFTNGTQLGNKY